MHDRVRVAGLVAASSLSLLGVVLLLTPLTDLSSMARDRGAEGVTGALTTTTPLPVTATPTHTPTETAAPTAINTEPPTATPTAVVDVIVLPALARNEDPDSRPTSSRPVDPGGFWELRVGSTVLAGKGTAHLYVLPDAGPDEYRPHGSTNPAVHHCHTMASRPSAPVVPQKDWANVPTPAAAVVGLGIPAPALALGGVPNPMAAGVLGLYGWPTAPTDRCYFIRLNPTAGAPINPLIPGYVSPVFGVMPGLDVTDMDFCQDGQIATIGGVGIGVWGRLAAEMACPGEAQD